ncbi:uracil-DNA glycosylase [Simiduia sp. 21SJ11W-1]|uniref:uracil-DNA glycosylase n=1 Tax=Simiduia sp. 21SJ11W-1 TaxID=2909669 RepID=UPI0020A0A89F|nr:uracil-DNA glycosylase [Simiduia sp. 21SJ11W-1]UTA46297.1 uracil-DNA glycosylase [Simiduia sp. 21SJ11W-1]
MANILEQLDDGWRSVFEQEFAKPYMGELRAFLQSEKRAGKTVFPPSDSWFTAFLHTPLDQVKVVIVGQDPYHGPGQAHGLSFSVPAGVALPPSLKNIYKEIFGKGPWPESGDLTAWANQGVLLLNASLTVEQGQAGSHAKRGWLAFTQRCIEAVNNQSHPVVFLAWGRFAHGVCAAVDGERHRVIKTSHPSPLGATKAGKDFCAFIGSACFDLANAQLAEWGRGQVDWRALPEPPALFSDN